MLLQLVQISLILRFFFKIILSLLGECHELMLCGINLGSLAECYSNKCEKLITYAISFH